jgi:hypothetical protein
MLNERLLTATHIVVHGPQARPGYLQRSVISDAIRHDIAYPWTHVVSSGRMSTAWISNLIGVAVLAFVFIVLASMPAPESSAVPADISDLRHGAELKIAPGNTQVEKGTSLVITARFGEHLPDEAELVTEPLAADLQALSEGDDASRADLGEDAVPMKRSLNDPVFAAYLYDLQETIRYRVDYENRSSDVFKIEVFEYPRMIRADAQLDFPEYTGQEPRTVADTRRVSAPIGTQLRWTLMLNKPVEMVQLIDGDGHSLDGSLDASDPTTVTFDIDLQETTNWSLRLVDADGRENPRETQLTARAVPNKPVDLKLLTASDQQVSPLQEFMVEADISDDFGLRRAGLTFQRTGQEPEEVIVEPEGPDARNVKLSEMINFEQLNVEPYELVSYYVWAEDLDESGQVRRSSSDIFFAEVRPFDEVFRQGSQQAQDAQRRQQQQGGGGGSQETQELLEVQRQIVVGSWNVMRAASGSNLADGSRDDVQLLNESQLENLQRLEEKAEELPIEGIETIVDAAGGNMQAAADGFASASQSRNKSKLAEAMGRAQAAYQDLLQLQNRENEVIRSQNQQQQQGGGQGSSPRQQQIQQLELENNDNRYEDQRLAQDSESQQQSELRQTISRLRELATRQEDLNKQLRELEAALQMAESEEEREELRERLQRLREQQEQLLQDGDEVQDRMSQQEGEEMRESQQAMQEARENLQRSSEALRNEDANSALAAGTRAEQQLQQLQDSVRQQAANQFSQSLREMQASAEQMEQRQQAITEQLNTDEESTEDIGLRGSSSDSNSDALQQLQQQRQQLDDLLERMQQTVEESEEAEPLLAQKLYDAFQHVKDQQAEDRLSVTEQLIEQDFREEARELAESSQEDFEALRSDLDAAAESVLGSEVESLRLALSQLERLSDDIDSELRSARGPGADEDAPSESSDTDEGSPGESDAARSRESTAAGDDANEGEATEDSDTRQASQSASTSDEEQTGDAAARADGQSQSESEAGGGAQSGQPRDSASQSPEPDDSTGAAGGGNQAGDRESPMQPGQPSRDENSPSEPSGPSDQPASEQSGTPGGGGRPTPADPNRSTNDRGGGNLLDSFSGERRAAPITGSGYLEWSDRLRDVEELVDDPELRWQATQIRQSAREIRADLTKHSADPKWSEVEDLIATPLRDLRQLVSEELMRRAKEKTQVVPIDRDPVPGEFTGSVRQYYENLGSGR